MSDTKACRATIPHDTHTWVRARTYYVCPGVKEPEPVMVSVWEAPFAKVLEQAKAEARAEGFQAGREAAAADIHDWAEQGWFPVYETAGEYAKFFARIAREGNQEAKP